MSLFGRIIARAALPGQPVPPLARPKGMAAPLTRAPVPGEDETAAPLARAEGPPDDDPKPAAPLRRAAEAGDGVQDLPRLRRAAAPAPEDDPKAQPLRRAADQPEKDDKAQPLRRAANQPPEDDKAQALHRAATDAPSEEPAQPTRRALLSRQYPVLPSRVFREAPQAENLTADNSPPPAAASAEPDNPPAMALRRAAGFAPVAGPRGVPSGPTFDPPRPVASPEVAPAEHSDAPPHLRQAFEPERPSRSQPEPDWPTYERRREHRTDQPQQMQSERPRVVIEQIEVAITDIGSAGRGQADFAATLSRALRSRYLGG